MFCKVHFCWFQSLCTSVTTQLVSRLHCNIIKFTLGAVFHKALKSIICISMYIIWLYLFQIWPKYMTNNTIFIPNRLLFVPVQLHFSKISPFFPHYVCIFHWSLKWHSLFFLVFLIKLFCPFYNPFLSSMKKSMWL